MVSICARIWHYIWWCKSLFENVQISIDDYGWLIKSGDLHMTCMWQLQGFISQLLKVGVQLLCRFHFVEQL